jgi:hypothetical protein
MLIGVLYYAITQGGSTQIDTIIAVLFCVGWLVVGFAFLYGQKLIKGTPILHPEDYKSTKSEEEDVSVSAGGGD